MRKDKEIRYKFNSFVLELRENMLEKGINPSLPLAICYVVGQTKEKAELIIGWIWD